MKRVCRRKIQIDALTLCYEVENTYYYDQLRQLDFGASIDLNEFQLIRTIGRYYDNVYNIQAWNGEKTITFGQIKFSLANGNEESNTHKNGLRKIWLSLNNETLYTQDFHFLTYIEQRLGLVFHNVTSLDLCLDTPFAVSPLVKTYAHSQNVTTILNGKRITNRDEDRPELTYTTSGSLNKQSKYLSVNIKQRNAVKDKNKGITIQTYDKAAEIGNVSDKQYILQHYGYPNRLFRTEVHLNSEDIKNYVERKGITYTPLLLIDEAALEDMFFHFLNSVIRFQSKTEDVSWQHILGRS
jgi:hypothetical protein